MDGHSAQIPDELAEKIALLGDELPRRTRTAVLFDLIAETLGSLPVDQERVEGRLLYIAYLAARYGQSGEDWQRVQLLTAIEELRDGSVESSRRSPTSSWPGSSSTLQRGEGHC